jgi:hypothetical protein
MINMIWKIYLTYSRNRRQAKKNMKNSSHGERNMTERFDKEESGIYMDLRQKDAIHIRK